MGFLDFFTNNKKEEGYQEAAFFNRNDNSAGLNSYLERYNSAKWVYFGDNNQYPNYLNNLYNSSGLHSAIIDFQRNLMIGAGFEFVGSELLKPMKKIELEQFINFIDGQRSLDEMLQEVVTDYLIHGTIYFKVFWNSSKSKVLKIKRVEPSQVRVGVNKKDKSEIDRYYLNLDWSQPGVFPTHELPAFNPTEKDGNRTEIYRFVVPNNALLYNTLPAYASATNWINLDGEVSTYHKSNIENSINPSMTIKFYKRPANEEEKRMILRNIKKSYAGSENTGRAMVFFSDDKDSAPDVEPVSVSNIDKQFNVTAESIQRNICYAHKINPMIMGLKTPGSLGNSTELETSFEIYKKGVIEPAQKDIQKVINSFLRLNKIPVAFTLNDNVLCTKKEIK